MGSRDAEVELNAPTRRLRAALVVHSLEHNNIGRVYPFLKALANSPEVEATLVGWSMTDSLFPLLRDAPCRVVRIAGKATARGAPRALAAALPPCDVVHCFKNLSHLRAALEVSRARGVPLVLDLDDWELGLYLEAVMNWSRRHGTVAAWSIVGRIRDAQELEALARTAPVALTVNSSTLRAHFGGELTYTAADAHAFDPARCDGRAFRQAHGLPADAPVVGFLGTPHPHKGLTELLAAFECLRRSFPTARLLFVGLHQANRTRVRIAGAIGTVVLGYLDADAYPEAYAACDVIAIPQQAVTEGIMQTPAKLILAMASGRAIVATTVGDIPAILSDAGVLVPPGDSAALAVALADLLSQPGKRAVLGAAARARFLLGPTLEHLREQLLAIYHRVTATAHHQRLSGVVQLPSQSRR